ncbi:hypothetical protein TcWFU_007268 [Taenia crassiceps]|uniref:Uncharacterized protein n=1 Tax=Taenia crassiceps TaxID=6207 RepID=A0ABR4QEH1_9CEST
MDTGDSCCIAVHIEEVLPPAGAFPLQVVECFEGGSMPPSDWDVELCIVGINAFQFEQQTKSMNYASEYVPTGHKYGALATPSQFTSKNVQLKNPRPPLLLLPS